MKAQRQMLKTQLREQLQADDITKQLVAKDKDLQGMFAKELEKHDHVISLLNQNLAAQDNILRKLTETNANYAEVRKATVEISRKRQTMIQSLIASYEAYEDLVTKSQKGQEFYKKLESSVTKLLQKAKTLCKGQEDERAKVLEKQVTKGSLKVEAYPPVHG